MRGGFAADQRDEGGLVNRGEEFVSDYRMISRVRQKSRKWWAGWPDHSENCLGDCFWLQCELQLDTRPSV